MNQALWSGFEYHPHQIEGIRWMRHRESQTPSGGILCDEMGLGKTIQILGLMKECPRDMTLLVGPLSVLAQWAKTAKRFGFQVWESQPTKSEWVTPNDYDPEMPSLYLLNYERAIARSSLVMETEWSRVVFDEAHKLGNAKTKSFATAKKIQAESKWFLTATPITNAVENAQSLFRLLGMKKVPSTLMGMKDMAFDCVLCRTMDDLRSVIPSLPPNAECIKYSLDFETNEEAEFYRGIQGIIQKQWKMLEEEAGGQGERFRLIMRLRQISIHPQVYISARKREWARYSRPDFTEPSTKFVKLRELIEKDAGGNHRWLVFCHFHDEMELLQEYLLDCPLVRECGVFSGKLSPLEREEVIETSKEPLAGLQQEVLLCQLMAGGIGLNLQHFDRVVFMGPWWTASLMDQAIGRAVRIGQTEKVIVSHLVLKEEETMNIDLTMLDAAERKRGLCETFLQFAKSQQKPCLL